jgi:excinuclease ABC subunit C
MESKAKTGSIHEKVKKLPEKPGVYQFLNFSGDILYIGKAKNLRKRVNSYFTRSDQHNYKHEVLVRKIHDIHYVLVEDESDALLLENNLIKEYQPRYNILLKDDKTFPWIVITKERFPRVLQTRNYILDGSEYFGPYTSVMMVRTMLDMIRQLYKLRTCKLNLSEDNIATGKFRRCLEFDLGNCLGPCEGLQPELDYQESIEQIREILKGNYQQVIIQLKKMMVGFSRLYQFEQAEIVRLKIETLERYKGKSTIVNPRISHVDVYSMIDDENIAYVNFIKIVNGAIVQSHNVEVVKRIAEPKEEILSFVIYDLRDRFKSDAKEIIVPFNPDTNPWKIKITIPVRGDKKRLLDLSERNARSYKRDRQMAKEVVNKGGMADTIMESLKRDLRLKKEPERIECFDNSNIQGTHPVASCVVFLGGRPKKSEYRHFNIKTVVGSDDFASMEEIILRRYSRVLLEKGILPDLIVVDGGKGQLSAAVKSLAKLELHDKIAIIGIAKRLEEIYIPGDPVPLYLDKNSKSLRLIQHMRNEAHRFGITFHRKKRESTFLESELDNISGIGKATREKVLLKLKDIQQLKEMSLEEMQKIAGNRAAKVLMNYFQSGK